MSSDYKLTDAKREEEIKICQKIADKVLGEIDNGSIWKEEKGFDEVNVKKTRYEGTSLDTIYGSCVIDVPFDKCLDAAKETFCEIPKGTSKKEAQGFVFRHIIIDGEDVIVHQAVVDSGSALVKNREALYFCYRFMKEPGTYVIVNTTDGMEKEGTEVSGTVRMKVHEHVTVWKKIDDNKTQVQMVIFSDPMGKVPTSLYNSALKGQLEYLTYVKNYAEKKYGGSK